MKPLPDLSTSSPHVAMETGEAERPVDRTFSSG
jgi:hypothetical protein